MKKEILKYACFNSLLTAFYITLVASFLFYVPHSFLEEAHTVLVPVMMLMLFVFSAAITGMLVLGRPVLWYLEGKKKEAVSLLIYTLSFFLIIMIIAFLGLILTVKI